jgi:glyoxylase-like metal-dependent hydrolase (beta-lactamase superfamily II)
MDHPASNNPRFTLRPSAPEQIYVSVSALAGGFITLPDWAFVSPAQPDSRRTVPSLSFIIAHPGIKASDPLGIFPIRKPLRIMFDLGLRSSATKYPEGQQKHLENRRPFNLEPGIAKQLAENGTVPGDIDAVIFSHVHYDHHGDPEDFPNAKFLVGSGSLDLLRHGLKGKGSHQQFEPDLLPADRTIQLPLSGDSRWEELGPFDSALDILGDGSIYAIDTPGHLPGHTNLLCRVGQEKWVCLCGDAYHDKRILTGEKEIGFWEGPEGEQLCIHLDPAKAMEGIRRLRDLSGIDDVELIAAHDEEWWKMAHAGGRVFPKTL